MESTKGYPYCKIEVIDDLTCEECFAIYHAACAGRCKTEVVNIFSCCIDSINLDCNTNNSSQTSEVSSQEFLD